MAFFILGVSLLKPNWEKGYPYYEEVTWEPRSLRTSMKEIRGFEGEGRLALAEGAEACEETLVGA